MSALPPCHNEEGLALGQWGGGGRELGKGVGVEGHTDMKSVVNESS